MSHVEKLHGGRYPNTSSWASHANPNRRYMSEEAFRGLQMELPLDNNHMRKPEAEVLSGIQPAHRTVRDIHKLLFEALKFCGSYFSHRNKHWNTHSFKDTCDGIQNIINKWILTKLVTSKVIYSFIGAST